MPIIYKTIENYLGAVKESLRLRMFNEVLADSVEPIFCVIVASGQFRALNLNVTVD